MPIPFLLLGGAILTGGYGLKKGLDAMETSDKAEEVQKDAEKIYEKSKKKMQLKKDKVASGIKTLGELKLKSASNEIKEFAEEFSKIKNLKLADSKGMEELGRLTFTVQDLKELKEVSVGATNMLKNTVGSGAAGVLLGAGAYGGVAMLGTAGTGAAISGLSGVAATNATLAWLGGGTLAAGGGGVALGTAVLGGIIAGPALLLAGSLFNSKAKEKLENAKINHAKARKFASDVDIAVSEMDVIKNYAKDIYDIIAKLQTLSKAANLRMKDAIKKKGTDWKKFDDETREAVFVAVKAVQGLKAAIDVPLLTEDGQLTAKARQFVKKRKSELQKLNE